MTGYRSPQTKEADRLLMEKTTLIEKEREERARRFACPICTAVTGEHCVGSQVRYHSHTARYQLAASRGLVPLLPWGFFTLKGD